MAIERGLTEPIAARARKSANWGGKLFFATLIAVLIFFWWLLIYSGGAGGKHG